MNVISYVYAIVKLTGVEHVDLPYMRNYTPYSYGHDESSAWFNFLGVASNRPPTDEAIRAYEQIGYRCVRFKLSKPEVMETQQEKFPVVISTIDPNKIWKE
jgi:hypothetical protein